MRSLMVRYLVAWLVFGLATTMFVVPLNRIKIPLLGFPLGTYLAAQGALIVFVMMLFTFAQQRQRGEREPD
jgi:putative solute:sodium symporter small subunit